MSAGVHCGVRKPDAARLEQIGSSIPKGSTAGGTTADKPFVASMGIYVFAREVLLDILEQPGFDFGKEIIPKALATQRVIPYIFRGYWADVGTIEAFYDANIQLTRREPAFSFFHPRFPIYTHPRFLPASRAYKCQIESSIVASSIDRPATPVSMQSLTFAATSSGSSA